MGIFDIFKRQDKSKSETEQSATPTDFKTQLDIVEKDVFAKLKPLGFKKNGRTFNRRLDDGIIQVINFQSGQYPIGQGYEIPGLRENLYGKFVVNLGVCIESLYKFQSPTENKKYYKEYDCQIRDRLGTLVTGQDYWWTITNDNRKITEEIIEGLETKGFEWFSGIDTKEKIISNNGYLPYDATPRANLDIALIVWFDDKIKGSELFKEYYHNIQPSKSSHIEYVRDLAKELKIEL
ncbi:MAG: DUF4304 domain-containing protein [Bacteroidetes bacterium]|nr:DUF4304 domain-containing protein [Bacteroidota bacterium]